MKLLIDEIESVDDLEKSIKHIGQSKKHTHYEVLTNQGVGILLGWLIVFLLFPLFDHLPQYQVATISTGLFFISSYVRSYIIRRMFNRITWKK